MEQTNSPALRARKAIFNSLRAVNDLPGTTISSNEDFTIIVVKNEHELVPDFEFKWSDKLEHFRCYICLAEPDYVKSIVGYNICILKNRLSVNGFIQMYSFLHKHRGNRKDDE